MVGYGDIQIALKRARERAAASTADDLYLTELLEMSSGIRLADNGIEYRPFYVAARFLQQSRRDQTIKEADDVKFTGQVVPIASLLELQRSLDNALIVPEGFEAIEDEIGQIDPASAKAGYDAALLSLKKWVSK
ncbi:hypothetical protein IQ268_08525 [Oculatella sp. LEGE 06141]|uniref:hypothetical protein n=1 Tax=Oculatella sp. LEGE 06141 TaxID=1828648 RepID=UPI00187E4A89|nr:hypothetical protein [Oculatella sp. LEGE 06141]MBE9178602.1 hypothetical protein [Oculatella sp. LEGE 06141]